MCVCVSVCNVMLMWVFLYHNLKALYSILMRLYGVPPSVCVAGKFHSHYTFVYIAQKEADKIVFISLMVTGKLSDAMLNNFRQSNEIFQY